MPHSVPSSLLLVRVQDDLHGAYIGPGGLTLPYLRDSDRNTLHFTLNCIVEDHAYGKFNLDGQGQLKAKIVLLADPHGMPPPAGLGQVDTWYRLGAAVNPITGSVERSLAMGAATIVAPAGTAIPSGAAAIFYDDAGGIAARDAAVKKHFDEKQIPMEKAGMRSWQGHSERGAITWAQDAASSIFGADYGVHTDTHDTSPDALLESLGTKGLLTSLATQRFSNEDGADIPYLDRIEAKVASSTQVIESFLQALPRTERDRIGVHYESQLTALQADLVAAKALDAGWQERQREATLASIVEQLECQPGRGDFFLAKPDNLGFEQLDLKTFAERIDRAAVGLGQKVWREGMAADWMPIRLTSLACVVQPPAGNAPPRILADLLAAEGAINTASSRGESMSWATQRALESTNSVANRTYAEIQVQRQMDRHGSHVDLNQYQKF